MNGPEHFAEAERLLDAAKDDVRNVDNRDKLAYAVVMDRADMAVRIAGVHAQLAQAAAAAEAERLLRARSHA